MLFNVTYIADRAVSSFVLVAVVPLVSMIMFVKRLVLCCWLLFCRLLGCCYGSVSFSAAGCYATRRYLLAEQFCWFSVVSR